MGLIHHPVVDKNGQAVSAAVTALDLHDIARAGKTFGISGFYVITPLTDQQDLVQRILEHWDTGAGAKYNPDRRAALSLIRLEPSLKKTIADVTQKYGQAPLTVVTSARMSTKNLSYTELREFCAGDKPVLLLFGTAWGLAPEIIEQADHRLSPIQGDSEYNHLAVRSAASIILDRILSPCRI
ncbi:MAG: RNA methyltransferase [Desulfobacteraceae bacterium]|nr:RNA methyltransferase [Desulfobacteraceae bacterium]